MNQSVLVCLFVFLNFAFLLLLPLKGKRDRERKKKFVKEYLSSSQQQQRYTIQHYFENLPS